MPLNSFCRVEISVADLKRAKKFYKSVFEWNFESVDNDSVLFNPPDGIGGSLVKSDSKNDTSSVTIFIQVEDTEKILESIVENGGTIEQIKTEIPNIGWFAKFRDTEGNLIGLLEEYKK